MDNDVSICLCFPDIYEIGASNLGLEILYHLVNDCRIAIEYRGIKNPLFHAVKLVELDEIEAKDHEDLIPMVEEFKKTFSNDTFGTDFEAYIADARLATKEEKMCWWMMKAIYFSLTLLFILQILAATTNTAVFRQGQANNLEV